MALGKVYCFGPTFRAEKSKTRRHLTEFWMVEPEVAFMDLDGDMELAEDFLRRIVERVLEKPAAELKSVLERDTTKLESGEDAVPAHHATTRRSRSCRRSRQPAPSSATTSAATRRRSLGQQFDRPVIVHRYPAELKAFYFKRDPTDPTLALGMDVLAPEGYGEIIGGGQREDDLGEARGRDRRAQAAARGVRVVPRPAPLRQRSPRRLRPRHRAHRGVDLRPAPRARDHPVPAHDGADYSLKRKESLRTLAKPGGLRLSNKRTRGAPLLHGVPSVDLVSLASEGLLLLAASLLSVP